MIVAITIGSHTEMPESCPFQRQAHTGVICCHPVMDAGSTHLYCNYYNSSQRFVDSPTRCPLVRLPVDGVKIEAVLK